MVARCFGNDFLSLKLNRAAASYWIPRERKPKHRQNMSDNSEPKSAAVEITPETAAAKLGVVVCRVFLCAAAFEIAFALFAATGNLEIYQPDPKFVLRLKSNQDCYTKIGHKPVMSIHRERAGRNFKSKNRRAPSGFCRSAIRGRSAGD